MRFASKPTAVALLCFVVAGCGSSSKSTASNPTAAFRAGYLAQRGPLNQTGTAIGQAVDGASHESNAQLASEFAGLATRLHGQLVKLSKLTPPASLSSAFRAALAAANKVDADLRAISAAASGNSEPAAKTAAEALVLDAEAMTSSAAPIKQKLGIK